MIENTTGVVRTEPEGQLRDIEVHFKVLKIKRQSSWQDLYKLVLSLFPTVFLLVTETDMYGQHLKRLVERLTTFEKKPKSIEGRRIAEWFTVGENIFYELYALGNYVKWDYSLIKKGSEVNEVIINITKNQEWLQTFVNIYPNLRIDLDLVGSAGDVCKVRSGIEILLRGFINVDDRFNKVLQDLEELGELDEFDRCLKVWRNTGHRPDFAPNEKQSVTPKHHWWWY